MRIRIIIFGNAEGSVRRFCDDRVFGLGYWSESCHLGAAGCVELNRFLLEWRNLKHK